MFLSVATNQSALASTACLVAARRHTVNEGRPAPIELKCISTGIPRTVIKERDISPSDNKSSALVTTACFVVAQQHIANKARPAPIELKCVSNVTTGHRKVEYYNCYY